MRDGDEKVRVVEDLCGFLIDLTIAAEYGWLKMVGVSWLVVISDVFAIGNLPCCISIQLRTDETCYLPTSFQSYLLSCTLWIVSKRR